MRAGAPFSSAWDRVVMRGSGYDRDGVDLARTPPIPTSCVSGRADAEVPRGNVGDAGPGGVHERSDDIAVG